MRPPDWTDHALSAVLIAGGMGLLLAGRDSAGIIMGMIGITFAWGRGIL